MDQRIIDLYDEYTHAPLDRRVFLDRLARLAGGVVAAGALLPLLEAGRALAAQVPPGDPRVAAERISYPGATGPVGGYVARGAEAARRPAVIVIHENRGLNAHIEDVARRLALAGFLALAPDMLSPSGGTPPDEDRAREAIGKLEPRDAVSNLRAAVAWLEGHSHATGKVGAVGFCWGGGMVNALAVEEPELDAGVVFYGRSPDLAKVERIRAPLLLHYAGLDDRINEGVPAFERALGAAGKTYAIHRYEGAQHAFHNDAAGVRHDPRAAALAWRRTVDFLAAALA